MKPPGSDRGPALPGERSESGMSIAVVLMLGIVAMLMLQAGSAVILPMYRKATSSRLQDQMRASCETILDNTVEQLNLGGANRIAVDTGQAISVASSLLTNKSFSGTVQVSSIPCPSYSYLYDQFADVNNANSYVTEAGLSNGWRVVTATVKNGLGLQKSVRVILKPVYDTGTQKFTTTGTAITTTTSIVSSTTTTTGTPQPIFKFALYAGKGVSGSGNFTTASYRSSHQSWGYANMGGDVGTGAPIALSGNATIGGNLVTYNSGSGVSMSGNATVTGQIQADGTYSSSGNALVNNQMFTSSDTGTTDPTVGSVTTANQSGSINGSVAGSGATSGGNVNGVAQNYTTNNTPPAVPQVPSAPSGATNLGTLSLSGNKSTTISTPGAYVVNSLSMSGNASLNITAKGPVDIYIQGSGSNNGFTISGNGMVNSSGIPADVRIWYGGTGKVSISGNGDFVGTVFAPNAPISVTGNGNVKGAMIGSTISSSGNGTFYYDRDLGSGSGITWTPTITTTTTHVVTATTTTITAVTTTTTVDTAIQYMQVVSWTEY